MVSLSHNCPWLTEEPKHSLERSFCGEWHETMCVCGQPFFDGRNQSMKWSKGEKKTLWERKWSLGLILIPCFSLLCDLRFFNPIDLFLTTLVLLCSWISTQFFVQDLSVFHCPLPQLILFVSFPHVVHKLFFLLMCPEWSMGLSTFSAEPWCGNRLAVCVLHLACS